MECPGCETNQDCAPFDDGNLCNGAPICVAGECQNTGAAVDCSSIPTSACQEAVCVPETGACAVVPLSDGTPCNPGTLCSGNGFCNTGAALARP